MSFLKKNSFVLAIMIFVLAGVAFWLTKKDQGTNEATIVVTEQGGVQENNTAELAERLALLERLSIKRDIFEQPAFKRLQPNLVDVPRPIFRSNNPFAPIGQRSDRFATGTTPGLTNPVVGSGAQSAVSTTSAATPKPAAPNTN